MQILHSTDLPVSKPFWKFSYFSLNRNKTHFQPQLGFYVVPRSMGTPGGNVADFVPGLPPAMQWLYTHILEGEDGPPPTPGGGIVAGLYSKFGYPKEKLLPVIAALCTDPRMADLLKNANKTFRNLEKPRSNYWQLEEGAWKKLTIAYDVHEKPRAYDWQPAGDGWRRTYDRGAPPGWESRLFDAILAALYGIPKLEKLTPGDREELHLEVAQMCDDLAEWLERFESDPTMWELVMRDELISVVETYTGVRPERDLPWGKQNLEPGDYLPGRPPTLADVLRRYGEEMRRKAISAGALSTRKSHRYDLKTRHFIKEMDKYFRDAVGNPRRGYTATLALVLLGVEVETETIRSMTKSLASRDGR